MFTFNIKIFKECPVLFVPDRIIDSQYHSSGSYSYEKQQEEYENRYNELKEEATEAIGLVGEIMKEEWDSLAPYVDLMRYLLLGLLLVAVIWLIMDDEEYDPNEEFSWK